MRNLVDRTPSRTKHLFGKIMEFTQNNFCGIMRRILMFCGQWPYQKRRSRLLGMTVMYTALLSFIIPQVAKFFQCGKNIQCILEATPSSLLLVIIMIKYYACQFNSSRMKYFIDYLLDDWNKLENPEEYKIMKEYAANGRRFVLIYTSWCHTISFLFVCFSLTPYILDRIAPLNESRPIILPCEIYYFVDAKEYFRYIFIHTMVTLHIIIMGLLAHDCMLLYYIEHICSIFAIAGFRFEKIASGAYKNVDVMKFSNLGNYYNKRIAISVSAHWRALDFADLLEDTFTMTFALQIVLVSIGISITLLQVVLSNVTLEAMRYAGFVISQLVHLFFLNLQGQKLVDHSSQVRDKIYNSSWFEIPAKSQMLLLYVMRKSLQPNFISAGKIYIFSLKSFATLLQTSVSYFTVLTSLQ